MSDRRPAGEAAFLEGGGEMGGRVRAHDWSATPLGPPAAWPPALKTTVRMMLAARQPMLILWGDDLIQLYNDACRVPLGAERHPHYLGQPARLCWSDNWSVFEPQLEQVMAGRGATWREDERLTIVRDGRVQDIYWTYSFTPIHDESGGPGVGGVLVLCNEVTAQHVAAQVDNARAARILGAMSEGFMILDAAFRVVEVNPEGLRLAELARAQMVGRAPWEIWPQMLGGRIEAAYHQAMSERTPVDLQHRYNELWLDLRLYPMEDGLAAFYRDITATKQAEEALRESESRLRIAQEAGGIGAYEWDLKTGELYTSDVARRLWGIAPDAELTMAMAVQMIHPEDRPYALPVSDRPMEDLVGASEYRIIRGDTGEVRWMARHVEIVRGAAGAAARVIGAFRDITESKHFEEHQQLLINELNHRVKNTLATVQYISAQTLRVSSSIEEAGLAFEDRLLSLSRAHNVLTRANWESAGLRDIVAEAMTPYGAVAEQRLRMSGPDVRLAPHTALAIAMALQELATNAAKYGSLSSETGRIDIDWTIAPSARGDRLKLVWAESGGPLVAAPTRRGFGSRLLERGLAREIGGEVRLAFAADGVVCTMEGPIEAGPDIAHGMSRRESPNRPVS
ncbi:sensor histidine kinase [Phenylobacterium sp.]|uniref:sensor histidine kinase n=1 Tax=Phenylobacterium sp. TaxID=1871053 RepID=UPI002735E82C|nr:HWE histidine kinase domain-containing protein [Phenylobacterium sp.]MDP3855879.1 HWE histidine kinase domain-containing protein [Phenylobacterium sp.]